MTGMQCFVGYGCKLYVEMLILFTQLLRVGPMYSNYTCADVTEIIEWQEFSHL